MNWDSRNDVKNKSEAIMALADGIFQKVTSKDLYAYADKHGIPLELEVPVEIPIENSSDEYYESSEYEYDYDYYESSNC